MRSAREDTVRGAIDRIIGRMLEAIGAYNGSRRTVMMGKAARARGAGRRFKGRVKRHAR
jgi:uncharacterized protein YjbJ (UPF0337 family)